MEKDSNILQIQPCDSLCTNVSQTQALMSSVTTPCTGGDEVNISEQRTGCDGQPLKYQVFYEHLYKCLSFLESENRKLLDMIRNKTRVTTEPIALEHLLDEFALKVSSKKDEFEKNQINQAVAEGQQAFMAKRWKMRYHNLLDLALMMEKKLNIDGDTKVETSIEEQSEREQLCNEATSFPWDPENSVTTSTDLGIEDIALEFDGCSAERSLTNYDQNDFTMLLSSVFIQDLLADYNRCTEEVKRQNETKCRLFHILKKTKDQRNQLKRCVSDQEVEIKNMQRRIQDIETTLCRVTKNSTLVTNGAPVHNEVPGLLDKKSLCDDAETGRLLHPTANVDAEGEDQVLMQQLLAEVQQLEYRKKELEEMLSEEEQQRRFLSKRIQDLIGTIHVSCRIRPHPDSYLQIISDDKILCPKSLVHSSAPRLPGQSNNENEEINSKIRCFIFEKVFGPEACHQDIFKKLAQSLSACLEGHSFCVMTYGPKKSGKSFTMFGTTAELTVDGETASAKTEKGIVQEALNHLLTQSRQRMGWKHEFRVQLLAITDDSVTDLLVGTRTEVTCSVSPGVDEGHGNNGTYELTSNDEFEQILRTTLQEESRKGSHQPYHLIVKVTIRSTPKCNTLTTNSCDSGNSGNSANDSMQSTVLFADLASWEKCSSETVLEGGSTNVENDAPSLSAEITSPETPRNKDKILPYSHYYHHRKSQTSQPGVNQSLLALSRTFTALRRRKTPLYYDSLLTRTLGPVLTSENSKCFLIITISPDPKDFAPTLASLQFAQNVMQAATKPGVDLKARQQVDQLQDQSPFGPSVCMPSKTPGLVNREDTGRR